MRVYRETFDDGPGGWFGYVSNAGTGNISGFALEPDGSAALLDADGVTAVTGGNPTDMALSQDGHLLTCASRRGTKSQRCRSRPTGASRSCRRWRRFLLAR